MKQALLDVTCLEESDITNKHMETTNRESCDPAGIGCPNKNAGFELRAIVVVLGWRLWLYKFCALCLFRLSLLDYLE
jgi:hypothetical protein